ncbi:MAG: biotin carboxylase N-terminal domain-containing protein, partial [Candidatus Binataceae bacterium]
MDGRPIKKLLVANRGEIALRIIRSARALGIRTVAVYSAADAAMTHVVAADEARFIGPAEAAHSYLNLAAIIAAAKASDADAIHPGYGFLSERPEFARAARENGLTFVGPAAEVMASLGDKVAARRLAQKAGVQVVPGIDTGDLAAARRFGAQAGFPLLVKAAAGGGGRGMRVVADEPALAGALEAA